MPEHDQKRGADDTGAISFGISGKGLSLQVEARVGSKPGLKVSLSPHRGSAEDRPVSKPGSNETKASPASADPASAPVSAPAAPAMPSASAPTPASQAEKTCMNAEASPGDKLTRLQKALREAFMANAQPDEIEPLLYSLYGMGVVEGRPSLAQTRELLMQLPDPLFFSGLSSGFGHPVVRDVLGKFISENFETVFKKVHAISANKG